MTQISWTGNMRGKNYSLIQSGKRQEPWMWHLIYRNWEILPTETNTSRHDYWELLDLALVVNPFSSPQSFYEETWCLLQGYVDVLSIYALKMFKHKKTVYFGLEFQLQTTKLLMLIYNWYLFKCISVHIQLSLTQPSPSSFFSIVK